MRGLVHCNQFSVGSASEEYPLTVGGFTGEGRDYFYYDKKYGSNKMKLIVTMITRVTTVQRSITVDGCFSVNLNRQPPNVYGGVLSTKMKIRPKDCITHQFILTFRCDRYNTTHYITIHGSE